MTDITSQDRRAAMAWAKNWQGDQDGDTSAAARVILATVDAPAPTLAEAVEAWADKHYTGVVGTGKHELLALAARADQMEHDLTEASAEVGRLTAENSSILDLVMHRTAEREEASEEVYRLRAEVERLTAERDKARYERDEALDEANDLDEELAGAESEVERLTAERDRLEAAQYLSDGSAWGGPVREPTVQKGAESNAESPDPADVQPGEAWLVECDGEKRAAVKDVDADIPWNTVSTNGVLHPEYNRNVTLITRLVPAPRVITNPDELDALPVCTILRDEDGAAWHRTNDQWTTTAEYSTFTSRAVLCSGPVTVLWEPEV